MVRFPVDRWSEPHMCLVRGGRAAAAQDSNKLPFDRISRPMTGNHPTAVTAGLDPQAASAEYHALITRQLSEVSSPLGDSVRGQATDWLWPRAIRNSDLDCA